MFMLVNLLVAAGLFAAMTGLQEAGRRLGERERQRGSAKGDSAAGPAEGAVYGLLGLLIAFSFSGASGRYETRRLLIVEEANAIGTAWLRLDLLPATVQPQLRELFRQYVDVRINSARSPLETESLMVKASALQENIWSSAVEGARTSGEIAPFTVLLPSLNVMFDMATTREQSKWFHPPIAVFLLLGILTLVGSVFAGYDMAGKPRRWLHTVGFAAVVSLALFVVADFEFPRVGFIRLDATDVALTDLRRSME